MTLASAVLRNVQGFAAGRHAEDIGGLELAEHRAGPEPELIVLADNQDLHVPPFGRSNFLGVGRHSVRFLPAHWVASPSRPWVL